MLACLLGAAAGLAALGVAVLPENSPPPLLSGRTQDGDLEVDGRVRHFEWYEPSTLEPGAPLVLSIHGSGMDGESTRRFTRWGFEELAEREGFVVAYPLGFEREWNGCRSPGVTRADREDLSDTRFLLEIARVLGERLALDPTRLYAAGISNGGQMAYRLAHDAPGRVAAVAALIAQIPEPENSDCNAPRGPVPVLVMNGTADPIVPEQGGVASLFGLSARGRVRSTDETIRFWLEVNGIGGPPAEVTQLPDLDPDDGSRVERSVWRGADPRREVVLVRVHGGGHAAPGGIGFGLRGWTGPLLGFVNQDIRAPDEIWQFFERHALPDPGS